MKLETDSTPQKAGYALTSYKKILDGGIEYLVDVIANGLKNEQKEFCPLCGKNSNGRHHEQDCSELSGQHIKVHNMMTTYLIK